jgi:hypothetical protein
VPLLCSTLPGDTLAGFIAYHLKNGDNALANRHAPVIEKMAIPVIIRCMMIFLSILKSKPMRRLTYTTPRRLFTCVSCQTSIGLSQTLPGNSQSTIRNLKFLHFSLDFSFCLLYSVFCSSHPKLCLCFAKQNGASPLLCFAIQYSAFASRCNASLCLCFALPHNTPHSHRVAIRLRAFALLGTTMIDIAFALLCPTVPNNAPLLQFFPVKAAITRITPLA